MIAMSSAGLFRTQSAAWCIAQLSFINLSPFSGLLQKKETRRKLHTKEMDLMKDTILQA